MRCTPGYAAGDPFLALAVELEHAFPKAGWKPPELARRLETAKADVLTRVADAALTEHPAFAELVLFVDQFEELFTLAPERYRAPFVDMIAAAADARRVRVVITLRADFYAHCTQWEPLARLLRAGAYALGPPGPQALGEMIARPAEAAGLAFEDGLVDRIVQDTGTGPGALALMEFLLAKLYEHRAGRRLTTASYDALKGVAGVVQERAEAAVREPDGSIDAAAVATMFRALVTVDPQTGNPVRRRATLADVASVRPLVDRLVAARLLVTGQGEDQTSTVEVGHEAVLLHWKRLVSWVDEHRELILWRRGIEDEVAYWKRAAGDGDTLLRGKPLADGERWLAAGPGLLSPDEQAFVQASVAARDRELAARRRRRITESAIAAVLLFAVGAFGQHWVYQYSLRQPMVLDMVLIPAGEFQMGSPDDGPAAVDAWPNERPQHTVTIPKSFRVGKYEVTYKEYQRCINAGVCPAADGKELQPVAFLSWDDASRYVQWLSQATGARYRLPTEAEWEYAARGGTTTRYWWGNDFDTNRANWRGGEEETRRHSVPVGMFPANPFGLHDTTGNVWELVADCYETYDKTPTDGRAVEREQCTSRVARGGSWNDEARRLRSATRSADKPDARNVNVGLRLAQDAP